MKSNKENIFPLRSMKFLDLKSHSRNRSTKKYSKQLSIIDDVIQDIYPECFTRSIKFKEISADADATLNRFDEETQTESMKEFDRQQQNANDPILRYIHEKLPCSDIEELQAKRLKELKEFHQKIVQNV